jgi:hypothetical protein
MMFAVKSEPIKFNLEFCMKQCKQSMVKTTDRYEGIILTTVQEF